MTYRILTENEWDLLTAAEERLYRNEHGAHAYTSVRERTDSTGLAMMWDDAMASVEMEQDLTPTFPASPDREPHAEVDRQVAMRVARAQFYVVFGELPKPRNNHRWLVGQRVRHVDETPGYSRTVIEELTRDAHDNPTYTLFDSMANERVLGVWDNDDLVAIT